MMNQNIFTSAIPPISNELKDIHGEVMKLPTSGNQP